MRSATVRLAVLGAALATLMGAGLAVLTLGPRVAGPFTVADLFIGLLASGAGVYFVAVRLVLRAPLPDVAIWIVLGVGIVMRAALLPAPPLLSTDIYRYVWDGRVQNHGINPYRYVPADPALTALRDAAVFPFINRASYARTIYPPAAQIVFAAVDRWTDGVTGMKAAMLGFEAVAAACLLRLLRLAGLRRERILIYLWNPLVLWSFAGDGHVDAVAIAVLCLALLARASRGAGLAGALLAAATLVKFLPAVVAPALLRGSHPRRFILAGLVVAALLYGPYLSVGTDALGFLPVYRVEEGFDTGSGFWLLAGLSHLVVLPPGAAAAYVLCAMLALGALALRIVRGGTPAGGAADVAMLCRDAAVLAACTIAVVSPHYAWYYAWLAAPSVVAPMPAVIWLSAAPVLLYLDPWDGERFLWPALVFVPLLALALRALWRVRSAVPPFALMAPEGPRPP